MSRDAKLISTTWTKKIRKKEKKKKKNMDEDHTHITSCTRGYLNQAIM